MPKYRLLIAVLLPVCVTACATVTRPVEPVPPVSENAIRHDHGLAGWSVSRSLAARRADYDEEVCLIRNAGRWSVQQECQLTDEHVERLYLNFLRREIFLGVAVPDRGKQERKGSGSAPVTQWSCDAGLLKSPNRVRDGYEPCTTAFGRKRGAMREIDEGVVLQAVDEADVLAAFYKSRFRNAKTIRDYDNFILVYREKDPDGLVPQAEQLRIRLVMLSDREVARSPINDAARAVLREWRKNLKVGTPVKSSPVYFGIPKLDGAELFGRVVAIRDDVAQVAYDGTTSIGVNIDPRTEWALVGDLYPR